MHVNVANRTNRMGRVGGCLYVCMEMEGDCIFNMEQKGETVSLLPHSVDLQAGHLLHRVQLPVNV